MVNKSTDDRTLQRILEIDKIPFLRGRVGKGNNGYLVANNGLAIGFGQNRTAYIFSYFRNCRCISVHTYTGR